MPLYQADQPNNHGQGEKAPATLADITDGVPSKIEEPPLLQRIRLRLRPYLDSYLPRLAVPGAIAVGGAIFAGTTYALVRHVQHLVATASVNNDPAYWAQVARQQAYDGCYLGCDDCDDPSYAYNACQRTTQINVSGQVCSGALMWNWRDRYPELCLLAVGTLYKGDALAALQKHYRAQYAVVLVTLLAGAIGGWITWCVWRSCTRRRRDRLARARSWGDPWNSSVAARAGNTINTAASRRRKQQKRQARKKPRAGLFGLAALTGLFSGRRAAAFPCTGYDNITDLYIAAANGTVVGRVHGWLSDCYTYSCNCWQSCSSCDCDDTGCSTCCSTICETCTASDRAPSAYVADVLPHVQACGFASVGGPPPGTTVGVRVANPGIEQTWWVRIEVSGLNVTDPAETDPSVVCLHDIGNLTK